jgi:RNA polymerase sigma factor (sigma-70 family)
MLNQLNDERINDLLAQWDQEDGRQLLLTIRRKGIPRDMAEDIKQQGFVKAKVYLTGNPVPKYRRAWLHAIVRHEAVNYRRTQRAEARRREKLARLRNATTDRGQLVKCDREFALERLAALMADKDLLPDSWRAVVELRVFDGLSVPETAKQLDVSVATVKRRYRGALQILRQALERQGINFLPLRR